MTTNTNSSRTAPARFFVPDARRGDHYAILDRTDAITVALVIGRGNARRQAAMLTAIDPAPREADDMPAKSRTSHVDCGHVSTKLARAICRKARAKANA